MNDTPQTTLTKLQLASLRGMIQRNEPIPESVYLDSDGEPRLKPGRTGIADIHNQTNPPNAPQRTLNPAQMALVREELRRLVRVGCTPEEAARKMHRALLEEGYEI